MDKVEFDLNDLNGLNGPNDLNVLNGKKKSEGSEQRPPGRFEN